MVLDQKPLIGLTAAGTAPVLNRIPFSLPTPGEEQVIPKNAANINNLYEFELLVIKNQRFTNPKIRKSDSQPEAIYPLKTLIFFGIFIA